MAGRIRELIDELVRIRTKGNASREHFVRALLMVKGIDPDRYDARSEDDSTKIEILEGMIRDFSGKEAR